MADNKPSKPGFESLRIWKKAQDLMLEVHLICKTLPHDEKYRTKDQVERSSSSSVDNIAEGYSSYYYNDKIKGCYTARKEAGETQNHIRNMEAKKYITKEKADYLVSEYEGLIRGINSYIKYISEKRDLDIGKKKGSR